MGITYGKLLYCHSVADGKVDKKKSTLDYNKSTVYECLNNTFTDELCIPDLHRPPITIDDIPAHIKDPNIPQICSQLPPLLPLKILLVIWPPLMIRQIYFLLMIQILSMLWRNMCIYKVGYTEDTVVVNMVKKDTTQRQGSIAPHALIKTRNFIIVMGFPVLVQIQGLASWNISIICQIFQLIVVFIYLPYFTLNVELVLCLFLPVPLITPCNIPYVWYDWLFDIVLFLLTVRIHIMTAQSEN